MPRIHLEEPAQVNGHRSSDGACEMDSTNSPSVDQSSKKRTRFLLTKQSKLGCYTCKYRKRRIKCDEERPSCVRCQRSGRTCAGYPPNPVQPTQDSSSNNSPWSSDTSDSESSNSVTPLFSSIAIVPWSRPQQQHFVELGCTLLGADPSQLYSPSIRAVFQTLVPQLSLSSPSVNAAAAAFGAAYESAVLRQGDSLASEESTNAYGTALRFLQLELGRPNPDFAALIVSSTLLAAADTIQARQKGALAHVLGAFGVFINRQSQTKFLPSSTEPATVKDSGGLPDDIISKLEQLCLSVDTQVGMFTWGESPHLPPQPFTEATFEPRDINELCEELPKLMHAGLHFVAEASQETLKQYADLTFDLVLRQSQMISWLRQWLSSFNELVKSSQENSPAVTARTRYVHSLKAQCLSMLLAVSNIRNLTQTSWDRYSEEFEEIIRCAEIVLDENSIYLTTSQSSLTPFCPSPGIIQPLYFTARKYRHSLTRRQAISLLRRTGFEGPFSGDFEADLAVRFVEIEEARPFSTHLQEDQVLLPPDVPDWRRIYSCWRLSERYNFDDSVIKFCRRRRMSHGEDSDSPPAPAKKEADNWETWEEVLRSSKGRPNPGRKAASTQEKIVREWVALSGEENWVERPLKTDRLSRDPDWVKSAVGSGAYFNFFDHPDPICPT